MQHQKQNSKLLPTIQLASLVICAEVMYFVHVWPQQIIADSWEMILVPVLGKWQFASCQGQRNVQGPPGRCFLKLPMPNHHLTRTRANIISQESGTICWDHVQSMWPHHKLLKKPTGCLAKALNFSLALCSTKVFNLWYKYWKLYPDESSWRSQPFLYVNSSKSTYVKYPIPYTEKMLPRMEIPRPAYDMAVSAKLCLSDIWRIEAQQ